MKLLLGLLLIVISIGSKNISLLSISAILGIIPFLIENKKKFFLSSLIIISLLPPLISPQHRYILLINSLRLILRFQGVFYIFSCLNSSIYKIHLPEWILHSSIFTAITLSLNLFPHLSDFITTSFKQLRLRKKFIKLIPGYLSFLLMYLTNYAEDLSWEIEIFIQERKNENS